MIKSLQKKFIFTAMTAVTVLIAVLLCVINFFNIHFVYNWNERVLDFLLENDNAEQFDVPPEIHEDTGHNKRRAIYSPPDEDRRQSSVYFVVFEKDGEITVDLNRIASVDEDEAKGIYSSVSDKEGTKGKFIYQTRNLPDSHGTKTVFLNISEQIYSAVMVMLMSLLGGILCWGIMLLIIILLSRRAIQPYADNFEKQKQFITDAGHEIKTPLAIIMANTEALELHGGENKWTGNIKNQVLRLNGLMQNLLLLAKTNGGEAQFVKEEFSFSDMVEQTVESFSEPAKRKGLDFRTEIGNDITLTAAKDQITSLVSILVDNAVKYSSENSTVSVVLKKGKNITLRVVNKCDELPDCPPEKLFDRFFRLDGARSRESGGYGIGLSAAKAIAEFHNGIISTKYGPDSTVVFEVNF